MRSYEYVQLKITNCRFAGCQQFVFDIVDIALLNPFYYVVAVTIHYCKVWLIKA
jgi:hypothetical protein